MSGKVIFEGNYRTSCNDSKWRIVEKRHGVGVEDQSGKDAMDKPIFSPVPAFEVNGAPSAIFLKLVALVKAGKKLANPGHTPTVIYEGEIPQANAEKPKHVWRLVYTDKGVIPEEETRRDMLGEVVYSEVTVLLSQGGAAKAIFDHLIKLLMP